MIYSGNKSRCQTGWIQTLPLPCRSMRISCNLKIMIMNKSIFLRTKKIVSKITKIQFVRWRSPNLRFSHSSLLTKLKKHQYKYRVQLEIKRMVIGLSHWDVLHLTMKWTKSNSFPMTLLKGKMTTVTISLDLYHHTKAIHYPMTKTHFKSIRKR